MNDREHKRLKNSIDKIKIAIEYSNEFLTNEEFKNIVYKRRKNL